MGVTVFSPCWLFGLRCPSTEACRLLGGGRSQCHLRELSWWVFPGFSTTSVLAPTVSHSQLPPPQETLKTHRCLFQLLWSHCFVLGSSAHETLCAPSRDWSFLQSFGAPALMPPWSSKPKALGAPPPDAGPQVGESDVRLRTLIPVGEPLWYNCFPVCGLPTWGRWDLMISLGYSYISFIVVSSLSLWNIFSGRSNFFFFNHGLLIS